MLKFPTPLAFHPSNKSTMWFHILCYNVKTVESVFPLEILKL